MCVRLQGLKNTELVSFEENRMIGFKNSSLVLSGSNMYGETYLNSLNQ